MIVTICSVARFHCPVLPGKMACSDDLPVFRKIMRIGINISTWIPANGKVKCKCMTKHCLDNLGKQNLVSYYIPNSGYFKALLKDNEMKSPLTEDNCSHEYV